MLSTPSPPHRPGRRRGRDGDLAVENLVSIFQRVFSAYWGPRTDDLMRAACLTLLRPTRHAGPWPTYPRC